MAYRVDYTMFIVYTACVVTIIGISMFYAAAFCAAAAQPAIERRKEALNSGEPHLHNSWKERVIRYHNDHLLQL